MRYLGGGIGHQNQDARWTSSKEGENQDNDMGTNMDGPCEENTDMDEDPVDENQLRELAIKLSSRPADEDDEDIEPDDSDNSSDGSSDEDETSDHETNQDDLFIDDEGNEDQEEHDFGPDDGEEYDDDTGFGSL